MTKSNIIAICAILLGGCASEPSQTIPTQSISGASTNTSSKALQVMDADGRAVGLNDVEMEESYFDQPHAISTGLDALMLREHILGRATPVPGVPNAALSAFFVMDLFNDQTILTRKGLWMPLWMPSQHNANQLEAQVKLSSMIEQAVADALSPQFRVEPFEWTDTANFGGKSSYRILRVEGPGCEEWSCVVRGTLSSVSAPESTSRARVVETDSPPFVAGDGPTYSYKQSGYVELDKIVREFTESGSLAGQWRRIETEHLTDFDYPNFYRRLSAALPDWAYIYVGPQFSHNEAGVPYVLHKGEQLLFVKLKS